MSVRIKNYLSYLFTSAVLFFIDSFAYAQQANTAQERAPVRAIIDNPTFKQSITIGFAIYAALKWFDYFNGFEPDKALSGIIKPAVLTYLAFNWYTVLAWFF